MKLIWKMVTAYALAAALSVQIGAKDRAIEPFLTGDLRALDALYIPVNLSALQLVTAFEGKKRVVENLGTKKGKALLVTFWSGDCIPCRSYLRELDALQAAVGGDGFEVIAINQSRDTFARTRGHLQRWGIEHLKPYGTFNNSILRELQANPAFNFVGQGPLNLLLGPDGSVRAYSTFRHDWTAPEAVTFATAFRDGSF